MASGGSSSKSGKNLGIGSVSPVNEDSSESEAETEPAKSFHRRLSTNREIKCSAMQNQLVNQSPKPIQKPPPQPTPIKQQPVPNPPQQQQQQQHQQPPPPKPSTNIQQAAEQMLTDPSFMAEKKLPVPTNSVEIPALGDGVDGSSTENNVQHKPRPFWMKRNGIDKFRI